MDRNHSVQPRRCPEAAPDVEKRAWENPDEQQAGGQSVMATEEGHREGGISSGSVEPGKRTVETLFMRTSHQVPGDSS